MRLSWPLHPRRGALVGCALVGLLSGCLGGCPTAEPMDDPPDDSTNSTFDNATAVSFDQDDKAQFTSSLSGRAVDFFKLGELAPGDVIDVDVQTSSGNLDPVAAIFDERENIYLFNDDRADDASDLNPLINGVIRGRTGTFFLGVVPFPGSGTSGDYRVKLAISRGASPAAALPQIVFLNWAGGEDIVIDTVGTFDLAPFDAGSIGPFSGRSEAMKDRVQQIVAGDYGDFDLTLRNSDDNPIPPEPHSTIHFGGFSRSAFAISEHIDGGNADQNDNAIVFTESFQNAFSSTPTFEQMSTAIGNTTAHELGHLLGLVHTKACADLMDTTCGNDSILVGQAFSRAPLDTTVFPEGFQDAGELLSWVLGVSPGQ